MALLSLYSWKDENYDKLTWSYHKHVELSTFADADAFNLNILFFSSYFFKKKKIQTGSNYAILYTIFTYD